MEYAWIDTGIFYMRKTAWERKFQKLLELGRIKFSTNISQTRLIKVWYKSIWSTMTVLYIHFVWYKDLPMMSLTIILIETIINSSGSIHNADPWYSRAWTSMNYAHLCPAHIVCGNRLQSVLSLTIEEMKTFQFSTAFVESQRNS